MAGLADFDRAVEAMAGRGWFRECVAVAMELASWADVVAMDPVTRSAFLVTRGRLVKEAREALPAGPDA